MSHCQTTLVKCDDETLRMVDALQFYEENGELYPANWNKVSEGLKATQDFLGNK